MKNRKSRRIPDAARDVCVIYARFSSHSQREESIEQQVAACEVYAAAHGWRVVRVYADKAISGTIDTRQEFQRMIVDAEAGAWGHVVTYKVDRFARDRLDSAIYKSRLRQMGITVDYAREDVPEGPIGILVEGMLESQAEFYVANLRQDVIRGHRHNADHALSNGPLPYGYRRADKEGRIEIDPPAAEVIKEIFARYASGDRPRDIAADLNARGILTRKGNPWTMASFKRILENERYKGIYMYDDVRIENGMPQIIDDELFDRVARRRAYMAHAPATAGEYYALSGKVFCGRCGSLMTGAYGTSKKGTRYFYYECSGHKRKNGCTRKAVSRDRLEMAVAELVQRSLTDAEIDRIADEAEGMMRDEVERNSEEGSIRAQLADIRKRKANVQKTLEIVASQTMANRLVELEEQEAALEVELLREQARAQLFDRDLFVAYLRVTRRGDIRDPKFRQMLFDVYVSRVYIYDRTFTVDLNSGSRVEDYALPDPVPDTLVDDGDGVRLCGAFVHQKEKVANAAFFFYLLYFTGSAAIRPRSDTRQKPSKQGTAAASRRRAYQPWQRRRSSQGAAQKVRSAKRTQSQRPAG